MPFDVIEISSFVHRGGRRFLMIAEPVWFVFLLHWFVVFGVVFIILLEGMVFGLIIFVVIASLGQFLNLDLQVMYHFIFLTWNLQFLYSFGSFIK